MLRGQSVHNYGRFVMPSVEILMTGEEACSPGHEYGGLRDYYVIHVVVSGAGWFLAGGHRHHLGEGDAFVIHPQVPHLYRADFADPWRYRWIGFRGDFDTFFRSRGLSPRSPVARGLSPDAVTRNLGQIARRETGLSEKAAAFWAFVGALAAGSPNPHGRDTAGHVDAIERFIETHFASPVSVGDITAAVGLNRSHASRVFARSRGLSIGTALRNVRMEHALRLLEQDLSVKEVAYSVGYQSYDQFLRAFRRTYGTTPSRHRSR